jgi:subtilisin family serine protease
MATTLRKANQTGSWPDVVVLAFGSPACDAGPALAGADLPPLGLQMVTEAVDRHDEALIVASAGNRSSPRPHYPAAFGGVVSVGALDTAAGDLDGNAWTSLSRSGKPADFSNYGDWVDVWAPGVDLSSTHVNGYSFEGGQTINGYALVRGTSFAAPYVAGLVAEQMAATGDGAEQAWLDIEAAGVRCADEIGAGVAVALTTMGSTATAPPATGEAPAC